MHYTSNFRISNNTYILHNIRNHGIHFNTKAKFLGIQIAIIQILSYLYNGNSCICSARHLYRYWNVPNLFINAIPIHWIVGLGWIINLTTVSSLVTLKVAITTKMSNCFVLFFQWYRLIPRLYIYLYFYIQCPIFSYSWHVLWVSSKPIQDLSLNVDLTRIWRGFLLTFRTKEYE